ncbi:MAG: hypothetical protein JKY30_07495 [Flavobacteriales bacterium]|nr:hypothetical protein [Flavobacteriales bacterium]
MKKKITYKQKLLYTLVGSFLSAIVIYNMTLANTIDLAIKNSAFEEQIAKSQNAPEQIQIALQKIKKIEQIVGTNNNYKEIDIHQVLLESVTGYVQQNGIILKDFPQPYITTANGYVTKTAQLTVEADFISLLKLIYFLESDYSVGKVVAVDFKTFKALRSRKRKSNTTIYLQNVKAETNEENS